MADPKLKLGNDIWATKQKSLLAYNDEGGNFKSLPFQVERISGGTYVGRNGLIQSAASNEPRVDFLNNTKGGLLLEPQRTNSITHSEDFSDGSWNKNNASITTNNATAPDGTDNADKITSTGTTPYARVSFTHSTSTAYAVSIFVKKGDEDYLYIRALALSSQPIASFNLSTGTLGTVNSGLTAEIESHNNGWYRCIIKYTTTSSISNNLIDFGFASSDNSRLSSSGKFAYFWGAQIEVGSHPTSIIPTSGGAVTRVVDFTFIASGLQNILNTSEGTLFFEVDVPRVSSTGSFERIVLSDQNASTDRIIFDNYAGNWRALMLSSAGNVNRTIVGVTANQRIKVAIAYSSTELRISYDGNAATTATGSYTPSTTLESFKFSNKDGGNKWNGNIYDARYFDSALSNAELVELTS
jgi:hypothetical protein